VGAVAVVVRQPSAIRLVARPSAAISDAGEPVIVRH